MNRIQDIKELTGKRVLVRVDYDVPVEEGVVTGNERILASLESVNYLVDKGAVVVLCAHMGRPNGQIVGGLSLEPAAKELVNLNKKSVQFVGDCIGSERDNAVNTAKNGDIILLENVRFHPEEEVNDSQFASKLANGCDLYINDAFADSHRMHASIVAVTEYLNPFAGFRLQKEVESLTKLTDKPAKPFVYISGGAKISDKIGILSNMLEKVDTLLIGGGMANTFLASQKHEVGCSLYEEDFVTAARDIVLNARSKGVNVVLPTDVVVTKAIVDNARGNTVLLADVDEMDIIADIGEETVKAFEKQITSAGTIFWNGPLGVAEFPAFAKATLAIGGAVADSEAYTVIGGGDTIASLPDSLKEKYDFVSMAGGASMEFLEGKELPGLAVLEK